LQWPGRRRALVAIATVGLSFTAALPLTACGTLSTPVLLHNSGEGVAHVDGSSRSVNLSFPSPVGTRTAVGLEPYVCTAFGPVRVDQVTLIDPTATVRLDRWGFYNGINGGFDGEATSLELVHATSHLVTEPCSAKWTRLALLYVEVRRTGTQPAIFYGVKLHYRSLGHRKTLTLDMGVEVCAKPSHKRFCPQIQSD
jgi:hypothetical protein